MVGSTKSKTWKADSGYPSQCLNQSFKVWIWRSLPLFRKSLIIKILECLGFFFLVIGHTCFSYTLVLFTYLLVSPSLLPFVPVYNHSWSPPMTLVSLTFLCFSLEIVPLWKLASLRTLFLKKTNRYTLQKETLETTWHCAQIDHPSE